jgi:hypothetical protein
MKSFLLFSDEFIYLLGSELRRHHSGAAPNPSGSWHYRSHPSTLSPTSGQERPDLHGPMFAIVDLLDCYSVI